MSDLVVELLVIMGKAVNFEFDPVEVRKGVYRPKGHDDLEIEQSFLRHSLVDVFSGKKAIPISVHESEKGDGAK